MNEPTNQQTTQLKNKTILVTGGAGFIGSNLCEFLLEQGAEVVCMDNFATGKIENILHLTKHPNFKLIVGDIRNPDDCRKAIAGGDESKNPPSSESSKKQKEPKPVDYILHQAALGSVPRSINEPKISNDVNVSGFLNMLIAARDANVKRFVYAASSSTYGDSKELPKKEVKIGKPLSPYAITKYVNELYADVFSKTYGMETIGLRYFNVFGRRQDPNGAYAAVIPKFVMQFMHHESPTINGDGSFSRDFTYIENVLQMNLLAMTADKPEAVNTVYNTAYGDRTNLTELAGYIRQLMVQFDSKIADVEIQYGPERQGDVPHSLASIEKAKQLLGYQPTHSLYAGLQEAIQWYWDNLQQQ